MYSCVLTVQAGKLEKHIMYTHKWLPCRLIALGVCSLERLDKCAQLLCKTERDSLYPCWNLPSRMLRLEIPGLIPVRINSNRTQILLFIFIESFSQKKPRVIWKKSSIFSSTKSQILSFEVCSLLGGEWSRIPCTLQKASGVGLLCIQFLQLLKLSNFSFFPQTYSFPYC